LPIYEDRTVPPLAKKLYQDPDWALVAFNDETLLFLERAPVNQAAIEKHEFREIRPDDWSLAALDSVDRRARATAEAKRAFALSPDSLFAQTALARAYMVNEQYAPAAAILQRFASDKNVGENYLRDFGYAHFRLGHFKEADAVFARMIQRGFLPGFAWYMRYFIASQEGQPAVARQFLSQAIKAEPANAEYQAAFNRLASTK
jgi:pentatricopeptide repeat protein